MFSDIHLNHEEKYFVGVANWGSDDLAKHLMFIEVASKGADMRQWFPRLHESLLGLGVLSREYLASCCL